MRRATAINLAMLGGGLSLAAATGALNEHNRYVACRAQHAPPKPGETDPCRRPSGSAAGHGGYYGVNSGARGGGGFFGSIARGGFGGFGAAHGGGA